VGVRQLKKELWPYLLRLAVDRTEDEWLNKNIGKYHEEWYRYYQSGTEEIIYAFKNAEDMLVFKLKYGGKSGIKKND
jgi:hypothetical protein